MVCYILVGTLAAFGLLCVLWVALGFLTPAGETGRLIYCGHTGVMDFARHYVWLRSTGLIRCSLTVENRELAQDDIEWLEANGITVKQPEYRQKTGAELN